MCDNDATKELIWNAFKDEWEQKVQTKPKLRTYVNFKKSPVVEEYVKNVLSRSDRSLIAKFRCGILQLHIETGRFNNTKLEERLCQICNSNTIEDEFHFLCVCPHYEQERRCLYSSVVNKSPMFSESTDKEKFDTLMTHYNNYVLKFLKCAWMKRREKLFV